MTEDEAKTRVCPQTMHVWEGAGGVMHNVGAPCIGSACMAWRWGKKFHRSKKTGVLLEESHLFRNDPDFELVVHGYCGLAGKP